MEGVDRRIGVGITERHAADQHFALARADVRKDDAGEAIPRCLRAGVETTAPRGHHDVLQKRAVIHQRAAPHDLVDGEHQADRRIKETEVALMLRVHFVLVGLADAQQRGDRQDQRAVHRAY